MGKRSHATALLVLLAAIALLAQVLAGCPRQGRNAARASSAVGATAAPEPSRAAPALAAPRRVIRFDERSAYQRVLVVDEGDRRLLHFGKVGGFIQSAMSLSHPRACIFGYLRLAMVGMLHSSQHQRVLMIGLGGGTFAKMLRQAFAELWIDAVEIDPVVVRVAKEFFGVEEDARFRIHIVDGAEFIERTAHRYDLILVDAYGEDRPAPALTTEAFYEALAARLSERGVAVVNVAGEAALGRELERRFRAVFNEVQCARTQRGVNVVLFGTKTGRLWSRPRLEAEAQQLAANRDVSFDLGAEARRVTRECPPRPAQGRRLLLKTDTSNSKPASH